MSEKTIYLKGINGIRAFAAIAVVFGHITYTIKSFNLNPNIFGTLEDGSPVTPDITTYGVTMFFALSGFLITFLLWQEKNKQPINVKKFYIRRALRIWPLHYAYILIILLMTLILDKDVNYGYFGYYVIFGANIAGAFGLIIHDLGHFWSLAAEEQFYLFWPWINTIKKERVIAVTIAIIVFILLLKLAFAPWDKVAIIINVTKFHCMLMGGVAGMLYSMKHKLFVSISTHKITQILAWGVLIVTTLNSFPSSRIAHEIITVVTILIIMGQVEGKGILSLELKPLNYLGKISYGIYVLHPLMIMLIHMFVYTPTASETFNYIQVYVEIIVGTILLAHLSYHYFELPFLRLKQKKYAVIKSSSSAKG